MPNDYPNSYGCGPKNSTTRLLLLMLAKLLAPHDGPK